MRPNDRQDFPRALVVPLEKVPSRRKQGLLRLKQLTMGDLPPEVPPEHLNRIEPGTVGGQVQQHEPTRSGSHDVFHLVILMGCGVVPGHIDGPSGMLLYQCLQQLRNLLSPFAELELHHRFAGVVVDGSDPIIPVWLRGRRDLYLLALGTPHRSQRGKPAHIELIGIIKHVTRL